MKKILSLLVATTLIVSAFATVAFAGSVNADHKLTLSMSEPEEKDGFTNDAIDSFIEENEFDIEDFVVYQIDFTVGNLPKLTKSSSNYSGEGLTNIAVGLMIDTTATYGEDFAVFPKGTEVTPIANKYAMAFYGNSTMTKLVKAAGVSEGGSVVAGTVYLLVKPEYYYNVYLASSSQGNMATFSGGNSSSGSGVYDVLEAWVEVDDTDYDIGEAAPATVDVTSVTISGATNATVGDNVSLTATVLPDNATDKTVTWTKVSGNGAVSDSGVVTATAAGDVVVKATAGGVDSANYTVSFAAAAPADIVPDAADKDTYSSASVGLHDASGTPVTIDSSRSYGAAKFENVILDNGEYVYKIFATGINKTTGLEETHSWDVVNEKLEIAEDVSVSFIAIVRSATHTITSVVLKAFAKSE